jgi:homoserine O-acetyltransferase
MSYPSKSREARSG